MATMKRHEKKPKPKPHHKKHHEHKKHHDHKKHHAKKPGEVGDSLKAKSTQTSDQAMSATPGGFPAEPSNAEAVYTTGPGLAVEYNYSRVGTYADQYAEQQAQYQAPVPPISGFGQVLTAGSAAGARSVNSGAANNPT